MLDNLPRDRPTYLRLPCHAWLLGSSQQVLRYVSARIALAVLGEDEGVDSYTYARVVEALLGELMGPGTARRGRRYEMYFFVCAYPPHACLTEDVASQEIRRRTSSLCIFYVTRSRGSGTSHSAHAYDLSCPAFSGIYPYSRTNHSLSSSATFSNKEEAARWYVVHIWISGHLHSPEIILVGESDEDIEALGIPENHLHAVILCAIRFIQAEVPAIASPEMHEANRKVLKKHTLA